MKSCASSVCRCPDNSSRTGAPTAPGKAWSQSSDIHSFTRSGRAARPSKHQVDAGCLVEEFGALHAAANLRLEPSQQPRQEHAIQRVPVGELGGIDELLLLVQAQPPPVRRCRDGKVPHVSQVWDDAGKLVVLRDAVELQALRRGLRASDGRREPFAARVLGADGRPADIGSAQDGNACERPSADLDVLRAPWHCHGRAQRAAPR